VHHDVKPGNVLIANGSQDDEHVLLSDFGVARAVGNADDPGRPDDDDSTLAYAAPEVITGDSIDGRADTYSLGCTLFRMLTGSGRSLAPREQPPWRSRTCTTHRRASRTTCQERTANWMW
jgi:serine/threonine protein kinase